MAALSDKLVADYTEAINGYLDRIPIPINTSDFESIINALVQITTQTSTTQLAGRFKSIQEMLEYPEDWVQPEHELEFKDIIAKRVNAKIKELLSMGDEDRTRYFQEQEQQQQTLQSSQEELKQATEKTSNKEPNTLSEMEWFAELHASSQDSTLGTSVFFPQIGAFPHAHRNPLPDYLEEIIAQLRQTSALNLAELNVQIQQTSNLVQQITNLNLEALITPIQLDPQVNEITPNELPAATEEIVPPTSEPEQQNCFCEIL